MSPAPRSAAIDEPSSRLVSLVYPGAFRLPESYENSTVGALVPAHSIQIEIPDNTGSNAQSPLPMSETEVEPNDLQSWTMVVRRKSHKRRTRGSQLCPELERTVQEAERNLTPDERERIRRRSISAQRFARADTSSEPKSYPKDTKGKGIDPKNWGALSLSGDEGNPEAQCAALASWKTIQRMVRSDGDEPGPSGTKPMNPTSPTDKDNPKLTKKGAELLPPVYLQT